MRRNLLVLVLLAFIGHALARECVVKPIQVSAMCGRVVATFDGVAIPGVPVQVLTENGASIAISTINSRGAFNFFGVDPGNYELTVTSEQRPSLRWSIQYACMNRVTKKKPTPVTDHL